MFIGCEHGMYRVTSATYMHIVHGAEVKGGEETEFIAMTMRQPESHWTDSLTRRRLDWRQTPVTSGRLGIKFRHIRIKPPCRNIHVYDTCILQHNDWVVCLPELYCYNTSLHGFSSCPTQFEKLAYAWIHNYIHSITISRCY